MRKSKSRSLDDQQVVVEEKRGRGYSRRLAEDFCALSRRILRAANLGVPRSEFSRLVLEEFISFSGCDYAEIRIDEDGRYYWAKMKQNDVNSFSFGVKGESSSSNKMLTMDNDSPGLNTICSLLVGNEVEYGQGPFTSNGAFWVDNANLPVELKPSLVARIDGEYPSLAILTFVVGEDSHGLILLKSRLPAYFKKYEVEFYQGVAQSLGVAIADRRAQAALRERVKELTCLYGIHRILSEQNLALDEALGAVIEKLPPAWLYPDIAAARVVLNDTEYKTTNYHSKSFACQSAPIIVRGKNLGKVEVVYLEERPELDEGPFLREERALINAVAGEIGLYIERKEAAAEQAKLEAQLRHADRLATIGQLAAGVAHELNEPLSNILGFAQLVQKFPDLPFQVLKDVERIVQAALHAREVVTKLMTFARQKPPVLAKINLNQLVSDGLYFLTARCAKSGIELIRQLCPDLPEIVADPGQLHQVLVNLVVNAIQAMPNGGRLTITTKDNKDGTVSLVVSDTGVGMSDEVKRQIFVPFYTPKPEGTGLGLSVVYGIVTAHGGTIKVESEPGKGSCFEVILPLKGSKVGDE